MKLVPLFESEKDTTFDSQAEMEENIKYTKTIYDEDLGDTIYLNKGVEVARWYNNDDYGELTT